MGWLINNPVGTMYGPYFLVFYFVVIVATIGICARLTRRVDTSLQYGPVMAPSRPDPFELAYLRGGSSEVARLIVYDLLLKNMLQKASDKPIKVQACSAMPVGSAGLSAAHVEALQYFPDARPPHRLLSSPVMRSVDAMCRPVAESAERNRLTLTTEERSRIARIRWIGIWVIVGLGAYKLVAALSTGYYNVSFLFILCLLGIVVLAAACKTPRLTQRGLKFLQTTQSAYSQLRRMPTTVLAGFTEVSPLLLVALFGFSALAGTENAAYASMFAQAATNSGSGGGCGTASSCGSGGGDGGGGDGGGGGCGGCGGGG